MSDLNGMTEKEFRNEARMAVVKYWNSNTNLVEEYGTVNLTDVYVTWQCKAIENFKALLGVPFDGDGLYFEFTYHANKNRFYLDVYKKQEQVIIQND